MATKQQLEAGAAGVLASAMQSADPKEQFCTLWSGTIRPALELIKTFTGPKVDAKIDQIEAAADGVCSGTNAELQKFCAVWNGLHMDSILKAATIFVGPKVKQVINKFIDIVDSICPDTE